MVPPGSMTEPTATPRVRRRWVRPLLAILGVLIVVLLVVAAYLVLRPVAVVAPTGDGSPSIGFDEATARVAAIQAREAADPTIEPACSTRLLDHGEASAEVIVLLHGYTNCPLQDDALAAQLAASGYTVYAPLAPAHGRVPGTDGLLDSLTGEDIAAYAEETMDIAAGLGDRVTVLGLSGGGMVASYIAQFRSDADLVIPIAAFVGIPSLTSWLTPPALNVIDLLPPIDAREPAPDEAVRGAFPHGASDTSVQGAAAYMRLGQTVLAAAADEPPRAGRVITVINDADTIVNNGMIELLQDRWARTAPDRVELTRLPESLDLLHDLITPDRAGQKVDVVYPILLELITGR